MVPTKASRLHRIHIRLAEIYSLTPAYAVEIYRETRILEILLVFYLGIALLLAFVYFRLENSWDAAPARISALTLIRLSITINTMPVFVTVFVKARKEEITGFGRRGLAFEPLSVYIAKSMALNSFRLLFFIPFTAIVYPIIGLRSGIGHVLIFFLALALQQMAAISIGLLVSASIPDPVRAGVVISTVVLITFLFSGSILIREATPPGLRWLEFLSISFYTHQALVRNEFIGRVFDDGRTGTDFLESLQIVVLGIWPSLGALVLYSTITTVVGIFALYWTSRPRRPR